MTGNLVAQRKKFPLSGEGLIYFTFEDDLSKDKNLKILDAKLKGKLTAKIKRYQFRAKENETILLEGGELYEYILIVGAGALKEFNLAKFKNLLVAALQKTKELKIQSINLFYFPKLNKDFFEIGKVLALSFYEANYSFSKYKSQKSPLRPDGTRDFVGQAKVEKFNFVFENKIPEKINEGIEWGRLISQGIELTKNLVNEPASHLHPLSLEQEAFKIEKESKGKIKVEVLDEDECRRLGMGAFLAVGQGSERKPKFIILKYQISNIKNSNETMKQWNKSICLIGKSVTFDSGGLSLKPAEHMTDMKIDMAGGAAVLGIFKILAQLHGKEINTEIYGILPACENMPSGKALKPGDIVAALNGKTIEVLNTDAEGRLTLADAICYAEKYLKPDVIIDVATLTGACMVALGKKIAACFCDDEHLKKIFLETAKKEGEEVWAMPLYKPYLATMKSKVADLKNISDDRWGGAITAALFLTEFVKKSKLLHLDVAGPVFIKETATGWGITSLIEYLKQW